MVTSPLGRLVTSKHTTKGHLTTTKSPPVDSPLRVISYCFVFFSHVQTTNLKLKLSRPNGIACLRKQKLPRRRAMYKCRSLGSGTVHLRTQRWRAEISLLLNSSQWVKSGACSIRYLCLCMRDSLPSWPCAWTIFK